MVNRPLPFWERFFVSLSSLSKYEGGYVVYNQVFKCVKYELLFKIRRKKHDDERRNTFLL